MKQGTARRRLAGGSLLLCLLFATGCIDGQMFLLVERGGGGTIALDASVSEAGLIQARNALILLTELGVLDSAVVEEALGMPPIDWDLDELDKLVTEDRLQSVASQWGGGMRLVRRETRSTAGGREIAALYRFEDVGTLRLGPLEDNGNAPPDWYYAFELSGSSPARLTIHPPSRQAFASGDSSPGFLDAFLESLQEAPGANRLLGPVLKEARLRFRLQVAGTVRSSNATYPAGEGANTFFLFDADAGKMPSPTSFLRLLSVRGPDNLVSLSRELGSGLRVQHPLQPFHVSFE